jgi:hypothetical protein
MKTCAIRLNCNGDENHPKHLDTVMVVAITESTDEVNAMEDLCSVLSLVHGPENMIQILGNSEETLKIVQAVKLAIIATKPDEDDEIFNRVEELDPKVDFLS